VTDPRGVVTHTEYDPLDRVSTVTLDPGSAPHLNLKTRTLTARRATWSPSPGRGTGRTAPTRTLSILCTARPPAS
jgi:hypothetical protein